MQGRGARLVYQDDWSGEYRLGLISIPPYDSDTRDLMRKQSLNKFQRVYNSFYVFIVGAHGFDPAIAAWYQDFDSMSGSEKFENILYSHIYPVMIFQLDSHLQEVTLGEQ